MSQPTSFDATVLGRDLCKTVERGDSRRRLGVQEEPRDQKERLRVPSGRDLGHDRQKVTSFHRVTVGITADDSSKVVGQDEESCGAWDKEVTWDKEVAASARTAPSLSVSSRLSAASAVTLPFRQSPRERADPWRTSSRPSTMCENASVICHHKFILGYVVYLVKYNSG